MVTLLTQLALSNTHDCKFVEILLLLVDFQTNLYCKEQLTPVANYLV